MMRRVMSMGELDDDYRNDHDSAKVQTKRLQKEKVHGVAVSNLKKEGGVAVTGRFERRRFRHLRACRLQTTRAHDQIAVTPLPQIPLPAPQHAPAPRPLPPSTPTS